MKLEACRNTLYPLFNCGWTRNCIVTWVALDTWKEPGVMQQAILWGFHRSRVEPSTLNYGRIRPSTCSLEHFSFAIVFKSSFPRHFAVARMQSRHPSLASNSTAWPGLGPANNKAHLFFKMAVRLLEAGFDKNISPVIEPCLKLKA